MPEVHKYDPGTFCWVDNPTADIDKARDFYTALFGWETQDEDTEVGVYRMCLSQGKPVAAISPMPDMMKDAGAPPNWFTYIATDDADMTTKKAIEAGGTVLVEPVDEGDDGRMAILSDPQGAVFGIWQAGKHHGAVLVNEPVSLSWTELYASDTEAAKKFYEAVFDWSSETADFGGTMYTSFKDGDQMRAGMLPIQEDWGPVPPYWSVYFAVEDCDATVEKAQSLGAKVLNPPMEVEGVGRFSVLQDDQGATFSVIQLESPPS